MSTHDQHSPYGNGSSNQALDSQQSSSSGPVRSNITKAEDRDKKGPIAAPVKSACTFCRSRKSRCDGNKPCSACVGRGRPDECLYTVSRRGGKPKPKLDPTQDLQSHLNKLFAMTDMPYAFRRPGGLAGPSAPEPLAAPAVQQQQQHPLSHSQQMEPHSSVFAVPNQYQSFDPSVLQKPSAMHGGLHPQPQQALPPAQPSAVAAFSLHDPLQNPFASMSEFQAGGFLPYQLPDTTQQPSHMLTQSQHAQPQRQSHQQSQQQSQQQQHQQQQPSHPHIQQQQYRPHTQHSQQQPAQLGDFGSTAFQQAPVSQGASIGSAAAPFGSAPPPPIPAQEAARNPSTFSPQSLQSPSGWGRVDDAFAAFHTSSVAAPSTSSQSSSSRHASVDNAADLPIKANPLSYKTLNAVAAEAGSVKALITDYYRYLYRFIPVLPPPKHMDVLVKYYKPDSAFIYALQCVLPLLRDEIQPIGAMHKLSGQGINFGSDEKKAALRERTLNFDRKANDGLDRLLEEADGDETGEKMLEAVQTLCVLVVYEYGSGRAIKARLKADQALGLAMGQGLHKLSHKTSPTETKAARSSFAYVSNAGHPLTSMGVDAYDIFEMRKRCWWSVWSLVLWAAYNTGRIPTIRADDPRVKSEMPIASTPDVWTSNISSLQALLLVQDRVLALAQHGQLPDDAKTRYEPPRQDVADSPASTISSPFGFGRIRSSRSGSVSSDDVPATFSTLPTKATRQEILDSMLEIDTFLQDQIRIHEATETVDSPLPSEVPSTGDLAHVEKELEDSLRMAAAVQLYTSSLTLHIGQAFQGASLFERKLCFLNSIKDNKDGSSSAVCREPMPVLAHDGSLDLSAYANGGEGGNGAVALTSVDADAQPTSLTQQDLYARGPFLPRLSLQRCVHASRKLLDIAKRRHGQSVNPNPFNCCSFVLISFVLLMQALAVHGGFAGEGEADGQVDHPMTEQIGSSTELHSHGEYANDSLQRVLEHVGDDEAMMDDFEPTIDPAKQAQLRDIWGRVREARDTLMDLGKHWEAVVPMADEVNLCLETSQLLLSNAY